ncbi:CFI-box-CTERM domain-containing protein [Aerosakkonemataceae cyanobacterium BLCC-F50]|uniref:CFI-box-CTERM domain-containing protein n=1 Tax=Floridaenema flaviceps BLCC-F50 TaxID=3153642 RepID=A0ABV4XY31_9CYAN
MPSIFELEEQYNQGAIGYFQSGDRLVEQGKFKAALEEYTESLASICLACHFSDSIQEKGLGYSSEFIENQISYTILIGTLTTHIAHCFNKLEDYDKALNFLEKSQKVVDSLANHDALKYSTYAQYKIYYEKIVGSCKTLGETARLGKQINEAKGIGKDLSELNEVFEKMCSKFERCCSKKSCLVPGTASDTKISNSNSDGCFITTAAYSTPLHLDLDTFRNFRDKKLLTNAVGKKLVKLYYQIGPSIAKYVEKQPAIKSFVRKQLGRLAEWMRK